MEADYVRSFQDKSVFKCQDPNNKFWANDDSRFGLKILKNMGWSEGKGLGVKEDGNVEHVKIKKKLSNSGIGETSNSSDNWLQGAFQYNTLLKRLNSSTTESTEKQDKKPNSSTVKENQSKKKHLYQKRLKSRDASGYSKEDMDLILGKSKIDQQQVQSSDSSGGEESEDESMPLKVSTFSIYDYFQKKEVLNSDDRSTKDLTKEEPIIKDESPISGKTKKEKKSKSKREEISKLKKRKPRRTVTDDSEPKTKKKKRSKKQVPEEPVRLSSDTVITSSTSKERKSKKSKKKALGR